MSQTQLAGILQNLKGRWSVFFYKRCLLGFPWYWPAHGPSVPAMVGARRCVRQHFARHHHPVYRALAKVFAAIVWAPAVLLQIWEIRHYQGPDWVPMKRVPGAVWAALRHNVVPGAYYGLLLWEPDRKVNIDNYLYPIEAFGLFKFLNRPAQPNPIDDKLAFHALCTANAIPTPQILAAFSPTGKLLDFESGQPPKRDLFVKPSNGLASLGVERFRWNRDAFDSSRGHRLSPEALDRYLATRARTENRTLLVQPALSNHPALGIAPNKNLAAVRLVTGFTRDGNVLPIFGHIYFADSDQVPAPYASISLVDVENGQLAKPQALWGPKKLKHGLGDSDSVRMLPEWEKALQYAKAAHRACSNFAFIGWDIAFTAEGPLLLEGNENWSAGEYQRLTGEPLGHTVFATVLATWLNA